VFLFFGFLGRGRPAPVSSEPQAGAGQTSCSRSDHAACSTALRSATLTSTICGSNAVSVQQGKFIREAAFQKRANTIMPRGISCGDKSHVFPNAKMCEMYELGQDEQAPGDK